MSDTPIIWKPVSDQSEELFIDSVSVNGNGVEILMSTGASAENQLRIEFDYCPSIRIHTEHVYNRTGSMKAWAQSNFWIVEDSDHRRWLRESSGGVYDQDFTNYLIFTAEECVDLLHSGEPLVEWINADNPVK